MYPRVLIVGTVPYNVRSSSRAFEAYFHGWDRDCMAQIFSNPKKPCKGHCGTLFQITDHAMVHRWLKHDFDTGTIYRYEDLEEVWATSEYEVSSSAMKKAYSLGGKHTAFTHLLRGLLWRKKYWCTEKLNRWMDEFKPECVFLAFSDDYFINQIALYAAKRYEIPIVSCIGDDYFFNKHFSLNPVYQLYKETYKSLIRKVLSVPGSAIYISDKIRDKYNSEFGLDGETVYLTSTVERKPFRPVNTEHPLITYFGNIQMGRNYALRDIGDALGKINPAYQLEVYSNESDKSVYSVLQNHPNIVYGGGIPYTEVQAKMAASDITVIVEGFKDKDIELSRYSLSTKAADALASGAAILTYGSQECGIIEYMQSTNASAVCTDVKDLEKTIRSLMADTQRQKDYYEQQIIMTRQHHNLQISCETSLRVINRAISKM